LAPGSKKPPALSVELLTAFRLLSGTVQADRAKQPLAIRGARPDDYAVLVEASQTDIASAIRAIDGVQKVTRQIGGWRRTGKYGHWSPVRSSRGAAN